MHDLLTPEAAFERFFAHWYEPEALEARGPRSALPDVVEWCPPGTPAGEVQPLTVEGQAAVREFIDGVFEAAQEDWPALIGVDPPVSLEWIAAFDRHHDAARVAEISTLADATEMGNGYMTLVAEFGAVLAHVARERRPALVWVYDWPFWDSSLLDPASGLRLNVFAWAMKKFTGAGVGDSSAARLEAALELLRHPPAS